MNVEECPKCHLPSFPCASEDMKRMGAICTCASTMPSLRATIPVQTPKQAKGVPVGIQRVTLPYPPVLNHLYANVNGRRVLSKQGRDYHKAVEGLCLALPILSGPVRVTFYAYRPRKQGDLDGIFKVILDSLSGHLWHDDSQVVEIHAYRRDDKTNPRVEIEVEEAGK